MTKADIAELRTQLRSQEEAQMRLQLRLIELKKNEGALQARLGVDDPTKPDAGPSDGGG